MTDTTIATGDAVAVKRWDREFMHAAAKKVFFAPLAGKDENNIVQTKNELTKSPGDKITVQMISPLSGAGVSNDADIEGQEEAMAPYADAVTVLSYMHAVRLGGLMTEQRSPADLRSEAKRLLSNWAGEKVDSLGFTAVENSPSKYYTETADALVAGGNTNAVTATDLVEPQMASYLRAAAYTLDPKIKPIKQDGREIFILLLHTHSAYDMKSDTTWQAFHRDLDPRDPKDSLIFKAGLGQIDDVLIYSSESVGVVTNWGAGANVNGAKNKFLGAQAMALAWAKFPFLMEKRFQYGTRYGACVGFVVGFKKLTYNSKDFGVIQLNTARTAIA